jgi:hypothetical protein
MKSEKPVGRVAISSPARPKMDSLQLKSGLFNQYPINSASRDCSRLLMTARDLEMAGKSPETLPDAPGRNINLAKIPATLAGKSVIFAKKINP